MNTDTCIKCHAPADTSPLSDDDMRAVYLKGSRPIHVACIKRATA